MLYLLKFISGSTLLWVVYHFGLEQEKMHRFKRFYLLFSLGFALVVPLMPLPWFTNEVTTPLFVMGYEPIQDSPISPQVVPQIAPSFPIESILWLVYAIIAASLLLRLLHNLYRALAVQTKGEKSQHAGVSLVILPENVPTHSFFNTIYINQKDYTEEGATAILAHELAHVRQRHSWDILFVELLRVLFWFNPVLFAYKRAMQLNHEFLADEAVIQQQNIDIPTYQYLLLDKIAQAQQLRLVQQFDYFNTKKRIMMMLKKTQSSNILWKKVLALPLFLGLLLMLCHKVHAEKELPRLPQDKALSSKSFHKNRPTKVSNRKGSPRLEPGAGVSQALLDDYIALVKKLKKRMEILKGEKEYVSIHVSQAEVNRLKYIYEGMSEWQKKRTEHFGVQKSQKKSTPPAWKAPTSALLKTWQNANKYYININGSIKKNSELKNYQSKDFAAFTVMKMDKGQKTDDFMNRPYYVYLCTTAFYRKMYLKEKM